MENHPPTRESTLRYLLHETDEDERERVDTLLISDEDYHAAFQEAVYDLRDALGAGELTPQQAERAIRALRPLDRATTQQFAPDTRPGPRPGPVLVPPSATQRERGTPSRWPGSWPVRVAAAALVLVSLALGLRVIRSHRDESTAQAQGAANDPLLKPQSPVASGPSITDVDPPPPRTEPLAPRAAPFAVLLLPRASRSPHTLHLPVPPEASVVRIDWPSASADAKGNNYQLQVITDAGRVACTTHGTALRGLDPPIVRFLCPARDVPSGIDFMRVTSLPPDPDLPSLLEVTVSVERKPASAS